MNKAELIKKALDLELGTEDELELKTVTELKELIKSKEETEPEESQPPADETQPEGKELYVVATPEDFKDRQQPYSLNIDGAVKITGDEVWLTADEVLRYGSKHFDKSKK